MKSGSLFSLLAALVLPLSGLGATLTTFSYTQEDLVSGSGTIAAPPNSVVGGVTIVWSPTALPVAAVRDPAGSGLAGGAVGGFNAMNGDNGDLGQDVAIFWDATGSVGDGPDAVTVNISGLGSDGNMYALPVDLIFYGDNVLPDQDLAGWGNNDFKWSISYGDSGGADVSGSMVLGVWLSPTHALALGNRQQRYTQNTANYAAGAVDAFVNTDTTTGAEKDAFDQNGNVVATAAIGLPLEIGFGWRNGGSLAGGPVLVNRFEFRGLLEYDEAGIVLAGVPAPVVSNRVPEPGTAFHSPGAGISFTATTQMPNTIAPGDVVMILNGVDVSGDLVVGGSPESRTVSYGGLVADLVYSVSVTVRDQAGRTTVVDWMFDTFDPLAQAPVVADLMPGPGAVFQDAMAGLSFTASTVSPNTIAPEDVELTLNGVDVSDALVVGGTAAARTVSYSGLLPDLTYAASALVRDQAGRTRSTNWTFNTLEVPANTVYVVSFTPPAGPVAGLTEVTVTFSSPVTGVAAESFSIGGEPATSVSGSGAVYTYFFTQPAEGMVLVRWDASHGITDLSGNQFGEGLTGSSWTYDVRDQFPPAVFSRVPAAGVVVRSLTRIEVGFNEPVVGVDAADLLVNGQAAVGVSGGEAGPYLFEFGALSPGPVNVTWAGGHGIVDRAADPNAFAGAGWSYGLDPLAGVGDVVINEILADNLTGLVDEDGGRNDWIELRNRGAGSVRLLGWSLTGSSDRPGRWVFPDVTLGAGQILVIHASGKDRKPAVGNLHVDFRLNPAGGYVGLYGPDLPRVLVSEYEYPGQRSDISYGFDAEGNLVYFPIPTPGMANSAGATFSGVVEVPRASEGSGLFFDPFELHLSSRTEGAIIRYTLDGSLPTEGSVAYTGPLAVAGAPNKAVIVVRAAGFRPGLLSSPVLTRTYIFPRDVLTQPAAPAGFPSAWDIEPADYEMDPEVIGALNYSELALEGFQAMPSLSIVSEPAAMFGAGGVYPRRDSQNHQACTAELILPDGSGGFNIDCGFEIQGGSSTTENPWKSKHLSMRLLFKGEFGATKLNYKVFDDSPVEQFDTLVMDAGLNLTWNHRTSGSQREQAQYVRDQFMSDTQKAAGGVAPHGRFVHLYMNGLYWGIYDLHERPDDNFAESYFGGDQSEYDVIKHRVSTVVAGDNGSFNTLFSIANSGLGNNTAYQNLQQYLDVPWFVDYMLVNYWAGNDDWAHQNWYAIRKRETGAGYRFISWDAEHVIKGAAYNALVDNDGGSTPTALFHLLRNNAEFRMLVADRVHEHWFNGGIFYTDAANPMYDPAFPERNVAAARYMRRISEIDPSIVCESARWGDNAGTAPYTRNVQWIDELDSLMGRRSVAGHNGSFFPVRSANVLNQLRAASLYPGVAAPVFNQHGGRVSAGFLLTMTGSPGTIYYTLNGADPRLFGGGISPDAVVYAGGGVPLADSVNVRARAFSASTWSALNEADFLVGRLGVALRFTEIMYHPVGDEPFEFLEIRNTGTVAIDLNGFSLSGVTFAFQPGDGVAPGERIVLANGDNPGAFAARYPGVVVFGYFTGNLSNNGEKLTIRDASGNVVTSVAYDDDSGWPLKPDGRGYSLVVIDVDGDPDAASNWRASVSADGTPGLPAETAPESAVVLNEVLASNGTVLPHAGLFPDYVEIHNRGGSPVDLGGWSLSDDTDPRRFVFPSNTVVPDGGYLHVWCDTNAIPGLNSGFALSGGGESLGLYDPATNRVDAISWGPQVVDKAIGRVGGGWVLTDPTMAAGNTAAALADVDQLGINEWLADPVPGGDDWVELFNRSSTLPVAVRGLYLAEGDEVSRVLSLTFVAAAGYLQLLADEGSGPDRLDFRLPAGGGEIVLYDSAAVELDRAAYGLQIEGVSEGRLPDGAAGVVSFPGSVSPEASNYLQTYSGPFLNEVVARNIGANADSVGRFVDWVELRNPSGTEFQMAGMALGDEANGPRWVFPAGATVPGNGYRVVWFDSMRPASVSLETDLNTGLGLDGNNGGVWLFNAAGQRVDAVEYGFQVVDRSIGLSGAQWRLLSSPTPGTANAAAAVLSDPALLRINEWLASPEMGDDWFELFNLGVGPVELAGLTLTDELSIPGRINTVIPPLSFIAGRGHVRVIADGNASMGRNHVNFSLDEDGEGIRLYAPDFGVIDTVQFGLQSAGVSEGRLPDGGVAVTRFSVPTPGAENAYAPGPPIIAVGPMDAFVAEGATATFEVVAGGVGTLSYQWLFDGFPIAWETNSILTLVNARSEQQGGYSAVVFNEFGMVSSLSAMLTVEAPPSFVVTPQVLTVPEGSTVTLMVVTRGRLPMGYRWRRGAQNVLLQVLNSRISTLTLTNVSAADEGTYDCIITNSVFYTPGIRSLPVGRITVVADTDGDGMSDDFENANGLSPNDPADAGGDLDGDGVTNLGESRAGTDPNDDSSLLRIDEGSVVTGVEGVVFRFDAVANHSYSVQCAPALDGPWVALQHVPPPAASGFITVTNPVPLGVLQKYYRLVTPLSP